MRPPSSRSPPLMSFRSSSMHLHRRLALHVAANTLAQLVEHLRDERVAQCGVALRFLANQHVRWRQLSKSFAADTALRRRLLQRQIEVVARGGAHLSVGEL